MFFNSNMPHENILLQQGKLLNSFQDNYYKKVAPHLPIMENMSTNKSNMNFLKQLEDRYNTILNQYIETSKKLSKINPKNIMEMSNIQSKLILYSSELIQIAEKIYGKIVFECHSLFFE